MLNDLILWGALIFWLYLFISAPILKPWFGFRKPKDHKGKWFE